MGLSETWLDCTISDSELSIPEYTCHRQDRNRHGGGVAVYISDWVRHIRRSDLEHEGIESVWLEIRQRTNKPLLVCNLYRPPSSSSSYLESIRVMLESALNEGKEVAVLGDLNPTSCVRPVHHQ